MFVTFPKNLITTFVECVFFLFFLGGGEGERDRERWWDTASVEGVGEGQSDKKIEMLMEFEM
jgi:hypothetical protein